MLNLVSSVLLNDRIFYVVIAIVALIAALISFIARKKIENDSKLIHHSMRTLIHEGKSPKGLFFYNNEIELLWRRILAFYNGAMRAGEAKGDILKVLSAEPRFIESGDSQEKIFKILSDLVHRTSVPEAKFVAVVVLEKNIWTVKACTGISSSRIEDAAVVAIEKLPLDGRSTIYTKVQNGIEFDFRGLGVGISLFVPMYNNFEDLGSNENELIGIVWVGFSDQSGSISEIRKSTIEQVVKNATSSFFNTIERSKKNIIEEEKREQMLSLSHDMKAPSSRALYALRELEDTMQLTASTEQQVLIKDIEYALEEQLGMIQGLFNIESLSRDIKNVNNQEYEISTLIRNRVDSFRVVARSMGIEIKFQELAKGKVSVSKELICRVLDNLISNGLKYSPRGNIVVKLEGIESNFKISVIDDGLGVDPDIRPYVFSTKIRAAKEVNNMGNRYGLTVVKKLVEEIGGSVGYAPNFTKGSTFWFSIPAISMFNSFQDRYSAYSILLIDDDQVMRKTHAKWLESAKYTVKSVSSFYEARQIIDIEALKLIITDVNIPGEELMNFIEHLSSESSLIILSGRPHKIVKAEYGNAPQVKKILEKPTNKSNLLESIEEVIGYRLQQVIEKAA